MSRKNNASGGRTVIGKIADVHGVRGTMLLIPLTDYPERFAGMRELTVETPGRPARTLEAERLEPYEGKGAWFFKARGIDDRETAELFKGSLVTVANDERVELGEDEYWTDDIVGLKAVLESGEEIGEVEEVLATGSNDVYVIRGEGGNLTALPAFADVILDVDLDSGTMKVRIPEGLADR